jgi:hypothetical protein
MSKEQTSTRSLIIDRKLYKIGKESFQFIKEMEPERILCPAVSFLKSNWQTFGKERRIYNNLSDEIVTRSNLH